MSNNCLTRKILKMENKRREYLWSFNTDTKKTENSKEQFNYHKP